MKPDQTSGSLPLFPVSPVVFFLLTHLKDTIKDTRETP